MGEITATTIAENRCAPKGSEAIRLYGYNGVEGLTLGQLVAAFSIRRAAVLERQGVTVMNRMVGNTDILDELTGLGKEVLASGESSAERRAELRAKLAERLAACGADVSSLPDDLDSYENRMTAFAAVKTKLDEYNSAVDRLAIELETCTSRRDTVYMISTTIVKHYMSGCMSQAAAF